MGMSDQFIVPAPSSADGYVELARSGEYKGHHWRKHLLNLGNLIHPKTGQNIPLDDSFYHRLKDNFENQVADIVAVPLANDKNEHVEDPLRNAGEVMGISREGSKVYVDLDIRDPEVHEKLKNRTLLGASAFLSMDYKDTRTGQRVGPTLLHSCITNRPYVTGLDPYEEVIAATADTEDDVDVLVLAPAQEDTGMTKEELLAALRDEHGIDVEALQAQAAEAAGASQLTAALSQALGSSAALSADGESLTLSDVVNAVAELHQNNLELSSTVSQLTTERAASEIDGYIAAGRVLPRQRAAFIELALTNRDMLDQLLPEVPVVRLNNLEGTGGQPQGEQHQSADIDAEIARYAELSQSMQVKK